MSRAAEESARIRVEVEGEALAEQLVAEAMEAGLSGVEECGDTECGLKAMLLYAPAAQIEALREVVVSVLGTRGTVGQAEAVESLDWSEYWRSHLEPVVVSPRLVICPAFLEFECGQGQQKLEIEPGQAFGSGGHESTFLALEILDAIQEQITPATRVLDIGTGTGVLALVALLFGAKSAMAFDIDPLAGEAANKNAVQNRMEDRFDCFTGPLEALEPGLQYELIVANMLRTEFEPLMEAIAARVAPQGRVVFSGLLGTERAQFGSMLERVGLEVEREFSCVDEDQVLWLGLLSRKRRSP